MISDVLKKRLCLFHIILFHNTQKATTNLGDHIFKTQQQKLTKRDASEPR